MGEPDLSKSKSREFLFSYGIGEEELQGTERIVCVSLVTDNTSFISDSWESTTGHNNLGGILSFCKTNS